MATNNAVNDTSAPFGVTGNVTVTSGNLLLPTTSSTVKKEIKWLQITQ